MWGCGDESQLCDLDLDRFQVYLARCSWSCSAAMLFPTVMPARLPPVVRGRLPLNMSNLIEPFSDFHRVSDSHSAAEL